MSPYDLETLQQPGELDELAAEYYYSAHRRHPGKAERDHLVAEWQGSFGPLRLHRAKGCSQCKDSGYSGRLGVYEVLVGDDKVRHAIRSQAAAGVIQSAALAAGMHTLRQDGVLKVLQGHTDIREIRATCV